MTDLHSPADAPSHEERGWGLIAHLGGPIGLLLSAGLLGFVIPLIIWLAKRDESDFVDHHGREALNFQLSLFALHVLGWMFVLVTFGFGFLVVLPGFLLLWFAELILGVVAGLRAHDGRRFRYPLSVRLIG